MSLLRKMANFFVRRLDMRNPEVWYGPERVGDAGEAVTDYTAMSISAVWACVNLISGTTSSLPLMVYRTGRDGSRTVAVDHPLYHLLHDRPNFDQTAVDFWDFAGSSIELWGNSFSRRILEGDRLLGLVPVNPSIMSPPRRLRDGTIEYRWSEDGKQFVETDRTMLHIRGPGGNPLGGMSTLTFGRHAFSLARATDKAAGRVFKNGLQPSGALVFKEWLSPKERETAEAVLAEKAGAGNAGKPMILEGGTDWKPFTINPEDAQMLESRAFSVEEICRFFGVPPHMVGHTAKSSSWGTGLEQQTLGFQKFTLRRRLRRIEQALMQQLLTPVERKQIVIEFSLEGLLRGDTRGRSAFYREMTSIGAMTINEVRALENLPPVPGGDVPRMQSQNVPITDAGKQPALPKPEDSNVE